MMLTPDLHVGLTTPGSAVFDLPTQPTGPRQLPHLRLPSPSPPQSQSNGVPSCIIISGGTGCNAICSAFTRACYVLPVSDDGGSSSEIIRVLGGPSIGDIRSRLVRLIPPAEPGSPLDALRALLAYRLPADVSEQEARDEWRAIVEGRSALWAGIPNDRKEAIRGFLVHFESEVLRRAHKNFSFVNGSIGNYFLAAAQGFFRSLPSAIFLFSSITNSQAHIIPVIVTNHVVTIAAELATGEKLVGQCEISHPVRQAPEDTTEELEFGVTSPTGYPGETIAMQRNVTFGAGSKDEYEPLNAPINSECRSPPVRRDSGWTHAGLYYINAYGQEIHPGPNPDYISNLSSNEVLVYSCGSLWTSIIPCLALRGVASAIARSPSLTAKILFLNSRNDRETTGYTAEDYISAIERTLNTRYQVEHYGLGNAATTFPVSAFITHLVYLRGAAIPIDVAHVNRMGVRCVEVESNVLGRDGVPLYDAACAQRAMGIILAHDE
ncbi:UPF0052-domain-containing protein [Artomyces pyxidatus]|uniref:UPF0052-domain-containing protein n=1 Tax=Artomyces pyxidatus TaxID=48021 RepID=A0ACB8TGH2_9AGAM|nr:UPF0052-domain-containing protein [Artomyces pyxidatus]